MWHLICLITLRGAIDMERQHGQSELGIAVREAMPGGCSLTVSYDLCMIVVSKAQNWVNKPFPCTGKVSAIKWGHRRRMFSLRVEMPACCIGGGRCKMTFDHVIGSVNVHFACCLLRKFSWFHWSVSPVVFVIEDTSYR